MKEWYIYEMYEVLSPTGKPYVGSSCNFYGRAIKHKCDYKLDKRPELIPIAGPYYTRKEAWYAEQPYRVANGWPDEREARSKVGKKHVESGHWKRVCSEGGKANVKSGEWKKRQSAGGKKCKENKTGMFGMSKEAKYEASRNGAIASILVGAQSKAGKVGGKIIGSRPWINKDGVNKRVDYNELETYLNTGWSRGRTKKNKIK